MTMTGAHRTAAAGRLICAASLAVTALAASVLMPARADAQQTTLPPVVVSPPAQPPRINDQLDHKDGGDGKNGAAGGKGDDNRAFERLNQELKRKADETNPVLNNPPLDARSPDTKTGVVNIPGVQQQYGKNFGNSVVPFRPPPPIYTSPLGRH